MAQKFIITSTGYFRYGDVNLHRELLQAGEECLGGGFHEFDYIRNSLELSGRSYDYGRPRWDAVDVLTVPAVFRGLDIRYDEIPLQNFVPLRFE